MIEQETHFHGYETQTKSFKEKKKLLKLVLYTHTTPFLLPVAVLVAASTFFIIITTTACPAFQKSLGLLHS